MSKFNSRKILFQISGSIAAYKACSVISSLVQQGHQVQIVISDSASRFIGHATLEGLSHRPVLQEMFTPEGMMNHIELARWADILILCPATANRLNQLAHGLGEDLISTIFLAHDFNKPYLVFPAMNSHMLNHPVTQQSIVTLKKMGVKVFSTDKGTLACGEYGEGKLLVPEEIVEHIFHALKSPNPSGNLKILVTAGGTSEPIDQVRVITNRSTGSTGRLLAESLSEMGCQVTLLRARSAAKTLFPQIQTLEFESFQDLQDLMCHLLTDHFFDVVIHAAAVSDFSVDKIETQEGISLPLQHKLSSENSLSIKLKKNPKLIQYIRQWSCNKNILLIGFKLTFAVNREDRVRAVEKLQDISHPDFIVANDLAEISSSNGQHPFTIYQNNHIYSEGSTPLELVEKICQLVSTRQRTLPSRSLIS